MTDSNKLCHDSTLLLVRMCRISLARWLCERAERLHDNNRRRGGFESRAIACHCRFSLSTSSVSVEFATDYNRVLFGRSHLPMCSVCHIQGPWVSQNGEHRLFAAAYSEHCDGANSTAAALAECAAAVGLAGRSLAQACPPQVKSTDATKMLPDQGFRSTSMWRYLC